MNYLFLTGPGSNIGYDAHAGYRLYRILTMGWDESMRSRSNFMDASL